MKAKKYFHNPFSGPVMVSMIFYLSTPTSRRKDIWVPTTPDLDNLEKAVLDALTGVEYIDGRFVVGKNAQKKYVRKEDPGVFVRVTNLRQQITLTKFNEEK